MNFRRRKLAALALLSTALLAPVACGHDALAGPESPFSADGGDPNDVTEAGDEANALLVAVEPAPFSVATYEGSGQWVHPDAFVFPAAWHGRRYWFSATPYPGGKAEYENPSVFRHTLSGWAPPAGVENPLARPEPLAYLSDPDLAFDPATNALRVYYRQVLPAGDRILLVSSADGVTWSAPVPVLDGTRYGLISPAIVRDDDGGWRMWAVDAGGVGCQARRSEITLLHRRSADGLAWGAGAPIQLEIPRYVPWHLDVQYVAARHEYWALVAAYPDGLNCSYTAVFFGRSDDGITWHMSPSPLLAAGGLAPIRDLVYRSTFHYHPSSDAVTVWFSGARNESGRYVYGGASARYPMAELLRRVERPFAGGADRDRLVAEDPAAQAARAAFVNAFP